MSVQWGVLKSFKCDCCLKLIFVFIVTYMKSATSLTHICHIAIGARQFVHSELCVYVWYLLFVSQ